MANHFFCRGVQQLTVLACAVRICRRTKSCVPLRMTSISPISSTSFCILPIIMPRGTLRRSFDSVPVVCSVLLCHMAQEVYLSQRNSSCSPSPPLDTIRVMVIVWRLRGNIIRTALCWIVWHSVCSLQQHTYMSSSYRFNRLYRFGLSHWDPYTVYRGGCLELYYCNMVEWFWWDSSLISTTKWFPSVLWHCWFGHLASKSCPRNDLLCVDRDVKPYTLTHSLNTSCHLKFFEIKTMWRSITVIGEFVVVGHKHNLCKHVA